ncbi:MAG: hypothetical protein V3T17_03815 [Pseudomonadales bacterium]
MDNEDLLNEIHEDLLQKFCADYDILTKKYIKLGYPENKLVSCTAGILTSMLQRVFGTPEGTKQLIDVSTLFQHPFKKAADKTFIGRITKGFDWLGYRLGASAAQGVSLAQKTLSNHRDKLLRLYERAASV